MGEVIQHTEGPRKGEIKIYSKIHRYNTETHYKQHFWPIKILDIMGFVSYFLTMLSVYAPSHFLHTIKAVELLKGAKALQYKSQYKNVFLDNYTLVLESFRGNKM